MILTQWRSVSLEATAYANSTRREVIPFKIYTYFTKNMITIPFSLIFHYNIAENILWKKSPVPETPFSRTTARIDESQTKNNSRRKKKSRTKPRSFAQIQWIVG